MADPKMRIVVNNTLKMGKGKIAAQVGHVVSDITEHMIRTSPSAWKHYKKTGHRKIVLKADQKTLEKLEQHPMAFSVHDMGLTQVEEDALTAVGFQPGVECPGVVDDLALL